MVTSRNYRIKLFIIISILSGVGLNFTSVIPLIVTRTLYQISIFSGTLGIFFWLHDGKNFFRIENKLLMIWITLLIFMILIGVINNILSDNVYDAGIFFSLDYRYLMYWTIGFFLARDTYIVFYQKMMYLLGVIGTIFGIIALIIYPYNIGLIMNRIGIWSMPYYLWWLPSAVFAYNFAYTRITGKNKFVGYGCYFTYLILGFLFLKRVALVNCIFLIILSIFLSPVQTKISLRKIVYVLVIIVVIILFILLYFDSFKQTNIYIYSNSIIETLFDRFKIDSFDAYDRANEATVVFSNTSILKRIFGYGLGSYAVIDGHLYPTLHTGIFNYLYKGGIFYLGFWIFLFIRLLILFLKKNKLSNYSLVCLMVAFSAILSSFYEFGFTHTIIPIGYATPIAYLMGLVAKEEGYSGNNLL